MADLASQLGGALRDHYLIERELGRGAMATVYFARDVKHDRPVALKVLRPGLAAALGPERFEREIRFSARLQHPDILTVLDSGEAAGRLWFTMPYVRGESLRARLRREGQLPVDEALRTAIWSWPSRRWGVAWSGTSCSGSRRARGVRRCSPQSGACRAMGS